MPEVLTAAEFERKQSVVEKKKSPGERPKKASSPADFIPAVTYTLQDPDLKTYEDEIVLNGRPVKRICREGSLITQDKELADFLVMKGYILVGTMED